MSNTQAAIPSMTRDIDDACFAPGAAVVPCANDSWKYAGQRVGFFYVNDMYSLASLRLQLRFKSFSGFDMAENLSSS